MTTAARPLVVGTRGSALALAQTATVVAALRTSRPNVSCEIRRITTKGDVMRDVPLATIGGRGVFADAIEDALRAGEIDFAVHSAKDLPSTTSAGLTIAAAPEREDPRDVLVSRAGNLRDLPAGARVGTSSQRRACQLLAARPDLRIRDLRGNVDTRLRKLDAGEYDAIVLAGAGLRRLGLADRVTEWLAPHTMLPAPGQGALAIECREDDAEIRRLLAPLDHEPTATALAAERGFLARLGAGCAAALAALATIGESGALRVRGVIGSPDGRLVAGEQHGPPGEAAEIGAALAEALLSRGGRELVAETRRPA
ncbi:MAG TPA: hydroxymethylbilane synthase [Gemmatimonadaceae bacterium]|nr:hydroxymethylbilane synthase [Gemmatimonadaceae bacterium]